MCGIAGIIDPNLSNNEIRPILQRMTDSMIHRGPDDEGFFVAEGVGLGMRRLSIIDVAGGHQPIANEDGQLQVILNGEIYNYLDLINPLRQNGHVFRTRSDTEVIVHLYEDMGVECLTQLCGMFGVAIWDHRASRLLLARDRLGKKPLFYAQKGKRLLFGSEIKSILAADPSLREPDPAALIPYFRFGFIPEPGTMFRHIQKLRASHYLVYEDGETKMAPYWHLKFNLSDNLKRTPEEWQEELDALLEEAVRIRLMSEVPLGVFLSGGLDSSSIVAFAHKVGLRPLKTFTIGFDRQNWDESADAQAVAEHLQTDHHLLILREQDLSKNLPETVLTLVKHFDEPFGDSSSLPTYHVSKLAKEHVTVILSGDGGDELFAGYTTFQGIKFAEQYRRLPKWMSRMLLPRFVHGMAKWLPIRQRYQALRTAKVLYDSSLPFETMYFNKTAMCGNGLLQRLFNSDLKAKLDQIETPICPQDILAILRSDLPLLSKASYALLRFNLLDGMLVKVDRMSMAHSLEVRSPILDHRLVEFAANLPPSLKLRGWTTKAILRDTVRHYLPATTLRKPKQGFSVPLREWLRTSLRDMVGDYLETKNGQLQQDMFNLSTIKTLLSEHRKGEVDHSSIIWLLLNYAAWYDLYIGHQI